MPARQPDNKKEFERIRKELNRRLTLLYRGITLEAHKRIVLRTPVDTGRARGNWLIDSKPRTQERQKLDKSGESALKEAKAYVGGLTLEDKTWIVNNVAYIGVLDSGGYPNPPKKGSWVKGKGYVIKSQGGFSKQAPHGMVEVTIKELQLIIPQLIDQVRKNVE